MSNIHIREVRVIYPSFLHVCSGVRELWYVLEKLTPKRLDVKSTAQIRPQCTGKVMFRVFGGVHCLFPKVLPQSKLENELCPNQLQTNHYDTLQTKLFSNSNFKYNFKLNFKPNFCRTTTSNYNFQLIFKLNFLSTSN